MNDNVDALSSAKVVAVPVGELRPNEYNPNQQSLDSFELLVKSIQEDGFTLPVVVNSGLTHAHLKNMIIDGEHRWRAALVLAMPEVPVIYKDMDEAAMRASTIRHNKARGHHDVTLEAAVIKELAESVGSAELSEQLNLDAVELDVMLTNAENYTSASELAALSEPDVLDGLEAQGLTGDAAKVVAHRHAMIGAEKVQQKESAQQLVKETGQAVRVELIYSGEQAAFMREFVGEFDSPNAAILSLIGE